MLLTVELPFEGEEEPLQSPAGGTGATDLQEAPNLLRKYICGGMCYHVP